MNRQNNHNKMDTLMELLIQNGFDGFADVFRILLNETMKIERDTALNAAPYERSKKRKGYANGYKPKTLDTRIGRLTVDVPQVRDGIDFYPSSLERGCRSERALKLAIAEMYIKGVSTRRVTDVLEKMCGLDISSSQVSRAAKMMDEELDKWRNRPLERYPYLVLDAHYEKVCGIDTVCFSKLSDKSESFVFKAKAVPATTHSTSLRAGFCASRYALSTG
jgi:transposase-like protein